jgi:uncharacterized membrane protein
MITLTNQEYENLKMYLETYLVNERSFIDNSHICSESYYADAYASLDEDAKDIENLLSKLKP